MEVALNSVILIYLIFYFFFNFPNSHMNEKKKRIIQMAIIRSYYFITFKSNAKSSSPLSDEFIKETPGHVKI